MASTLQIDNIKPETMRKLRRLTFDLAPDGGLPLHYRDVLTIIVDAYATAYDITDHAQKRTDREHV